MGYFGFGFLFLLWDEVFLFRISCLFDLCILGRKQKQVFGEFGEKQLTNIIKLSQNKIISNRMTSAQANRADIFNISNTFQKRASVTAAETRSPPKIFSPEEMENIKLLNLRQKRKQLQEKLRNVSNRLNYRRKKQEQQLRKFIKSQQKSITLMETQNYRKFNEMLKQQLEQRKEFQSKKKAKEVEDVRANNQRRLSLIYQAVKDRKQEQSDKLRHSKKIEEQNLKYTRQMAYSLKKEQCDTINKMKQRQNTKKRCYWFEKRMSFQQKMLEEAQIYQKHIENYYRKIQALKESQEQLKQQQAQAQEILKCAEQNFQLLKQS